MSFSVKLRTLSQLGISSIARVGLYRLGLKTGLHPVLKQKSAIAQGPFLRQPEAADDLPPPNAMWDNALWWFGWHREPIPEGVPDWFRNPFCGTVRPDPGRDWWNISDFGTGDIKGLWELSRFDWAVAWATQAAHGDSDALERLNVWLSDWSAKNPPYKGPNWKCGQEASIRCMHLVVAAWILGQDRVPEAGLVEFLKAHLQRIAPTMSYAIGQQNNHGTSEAAALFIGGSFLAGHDPRAENWMRKGRDWLEERAKTLIEPDGSFSQYSVTYHRLMLDTYSLAEAWRRHHDLPAFSERLYQRLGAATEWLEAITIPGTGDAPNIGANDGARLLQLSGSDYRDFRPSVQMAAALFQSRDVYGRGSWDHNQEWLEIPKGKPTSRRANGTTFDDGGYHVLRSATAMAVLRYPRFHFRPSQADALHLDFWLNGTNLLRDAGTYSYNMAGAEWFGSTAAHNTVIFDDRDQMPRLGRFLFGDWLKSGAVEPVRHTQDGESASAAYTDRYGASHHRYVAITPDGLTVTDTLSGSFKKAYLQWRLAPGDWQLDGQTLVKDEIRITISGDADPASISLATASESRYYLQRTDIPVLRIACNRPGTINTRITY